jgi:hypothetical protein
MNIGDLREAIKDLPDELEVRHVYWMGTCDLALPASVAKHVTNKEESEAYWAEPFTFPFFEIS